MSRFVSATLFDLDGATAIQPLATASNIQWLDPLDEPGSFSLSVPVEDAPGIAIGQVVKVSYGTDNRAFVFAGIIEAITINQVGRDNDGVARTYEIGGRGVRALLEDALVYNVGASNTRTFTTQKAGAIIKTLIDEAQARGALAGLTYGFTATTGSDSVAFTEDLTMDEQVGATLLSVADRHQELAIDYWVDPDLVLHYVNYRGEDLTASIALRIGQSIGELTKQQSGPVRNLVLVASGDGTTFTEAQDATSQAAYGRRETFLSLANNGDASLITLASGHVLSSTANPADGSTVQLDPLGPVPYVDFQVGDTVNLVALDGSKTAYRVRGISGTVDATGEVTFVPELGSARPDLTKRLAAALARVEKQGAQESAVATDVGGGAAGGTDVVLGEVLTYNPGTEMGTIDIDGTTYDFQNTSGWGLNTGDIVTVTEVVGVTDKVVTGVYERAGTYTPIIITNPSVVSGFPYDADAMSPTHLYLQGTWGGAPAASMNPPVWYGSAGELGIPGRKVVLCPRLATTAGAGASMFVIRDIETGTTSAIYHDHPLNSSEFLTTIEASGTKLIVCWGRNNTAIGDYGVEIYNTATSTWTAITGITRAYFGGVSNGYAWFVACDVRTTNNTTQRVVSVDLSTNAVSVSTPLSLGTGSTAFIRAKNGYVYVTANTARLSIAATTGNAASLTWTEITGISGVWNTNINLSTIPGPASGQASAFALSNLHYANSDIDSSGRLYVVTRTGSPATYGFYRFTPGGVSTSYTNIANAGGDRNLGEPVHISGLALVSGQVVLGGSVQQNVVNPAWPSSYYSPAYWRGDGVTTAVVYDSVNGNNASQQYGQGSVFRTGSTAFGFYTRWGIAVTGPPSAAGPAVVTSLTVS